ncbi:hypothetical protein CC80DRAFT_410694 [Byssothecium circinans]|uniref:Protein FAF1 n=1 Tax=Byssothecium circinans TaxID=147558 RepID=A0A6A5TWZ1_9PLEO|nr:hypothetical protein CC80DRAFT_410694 [Byssothecium circinans]
MAHALGKRKRITREELEHPSRSPSPSSDSDAEDVQALFRKAFEAKFKPLEIEPVQKKVNEDESEDGEEEEDESDWSGISSEGEEDNNVEVIDYAADSLPTSEKASRGEMRAFMSAKPPSSSTTSTSTKPSRASKKEDNDDSTEALNLKNDLALQNLLRESHILSTHAPTYSTRGDTPSAKPTSIATRHKLVDLHMQSLGAKGSIFTQKKMPMQYRKGIAAKATLREDLRRKEAKENGIILERKSRGSGSGKGAVGKRDRDRDRGVGAPSVGKFKNGTLTLSRKDVNSITRDGGGGARGGRKGKGKRGRR